MVVLVQGEVEADVIRVCCKLAISMVSTSNACCIELSGGLPRTAAGSPEQRSTDGVLTGGKDPSHAKNSIDRN